MSLFSISLLPHWNWDTVQTPTGGSSEEYWAMDESLTQQRRVEDEGRKIVNSFL